MNSEVAPMHNVLVCNAIIELANIVNQYMLIICYMQTSSITCGFVASVDIGMATISGGRNVLLPANMFLCQWNTKVLRQGMRTIPRTRLCASESLRQMFSIWRDSIYGGKENMYAQEECVNWYMNFKVKCIVI